MQKNKQKITKEIILLKSNYKNDLLKTIWYGILGILFISIYLLKNQYSLTNVPLFDNILLIISIISILKSIKSLYFGLSKYLLLNNERFDIFIDTIIDKRKVLKRDEYDIKQHQVHLGIYTCYTKKYYIIEDTEEFKKARINSNCLLIFTKFKKEPLMSFLLDDYILDENLKKNITNNLEKYNLRKE